MSRLKRSPVSHSPRAGVRDTHAPVQRKNHANARPADRILSCHICQRFHQRPVALPECLSTVGQPVFAPYLVSDLVLAVISLDCLFVISFFRSFSSCLSLFL